MSFDNPLAFLATRELDWEPAVTKAGGCIKKLFVRADNRPIHVQAAKVKMVVEYDTHIFIKDFTMKEGGPLSIPKKALKELARPPAGFPERVGAYELIHINFNAVLIYLTGKSLKPSTTKYEWCWVQAECSSERGMNWQETISTRDSPGQIMDDIDMERHHFSGKEDEFYPFDGNGQLIE